MDNKINHLQALSAENLNSIDFIKHGFFTRIGGFSINNFSELNTSYFAGDELTNVDKNRKLVNDYFANPKSKLITVKQVHSTNVKIVDENNLPQIDDEADALITTSPNIILGVQTADCVPLLMVDINKKIIAAIHCGHNGSFNGIIENTYLKMQNLGSTSSNIIAAIGPSIKQASYEVDINFYNKYINQNPQNQQFFINSINKNHYLFNLPNYITNKLLNLGITNTHEITLDTFSNNHLFFSHRFATKNNINRGLQISTIMLKE
ncbi:peptidoglycan editing factor PgeF [Rickettsiales bacterium LUAb2]